MYDIYAIIYVIHYYLGNIMHRTTVYLDEDTAIAIRQLAQRHERSQADIIREALKKYVHEAKQSYQRPTLTGIGAYRSGRSDIAEHAEEILRKAVSKNK